MSSSFLSHPPPPNSAGVGRAGAYIVIDSMLERIKHEQTVDIYGHVTCLRAQRNYMVQTEEQYIFIHESLLEAVQSGNTEVPARNLYAHIQKLSQPELDDSVTGMESEFKVCLKGGGGEEEEEEEGEGRGRTRRGRGRGRTEEDRVLEETVEKKRTCETFIIFGFCLV